MEYNRIFDVFSCPVARGPTQPGVASIDTEIVCVPGRTLNWNERKAVRL